MTDQALPSFEWGVIEKLQRSEMARQAHGRARFLWARLSSLLLAAIAVVGAFSGASAIANNRDAALVLGILTALLSGTNAGLQPADRAAQHRTAAVGYNQIVSDIERLLIDREAAGVTDWSKLRPDWIAIDKQLTTIETEAPSVSIHKSEKDEANGRLALLLGKTPTPSVTTGST